MIKERPPRLDRIFQSRDSPLFFVTFCTLYRQKIRSLGALHAAFEKYAERADTEHNVAVGRYVLLPDHVHLFVRGDANFQLARWVGGLKRAMGVALRAAGDSARWQLGFFDHLLRSDESCSEKWEYVRRNPVRHGLVLSPENWPHQGEFIRIDRA